MTHSLAIYADIARRLDQHWEPVQVALIADSIAPGLNPAQLHLFLEVARKRGLDPFGKQIYATVRGGKMVLQVGIDGYYAMAHATGLFSGMEPTRFEYDGETGKLRAAHVVVYRLVNGTPCGFPASALWDSYAVEGRGGNMWQKFPERMIEKCAESLALRKAFPQALSGLYTKEEMAQADPQEQEASWSVAPEPQRLAYGPGRVEQDEQDERAAQGHADRAQREHDAQAAMVDKGRRGLGSANQPDRGDGDGPEPGWAGGE